MREPGTALGWLVGLVGGFGSWVGGEGLRVACSQLGLLSLACSCGYSTFYFFLRFSDLGAEEKKRDMQCRCTLSTCRTFANLSHSDITMR
jgi:hypothetical protein